jgi:curved DNA-binding protein CbpA
MKDYYYILGVTNDSSLNEIKSAFRKLSFKFHPDQNNGEAFFANQFKEILEAYEVLSDENKRRIYDEKLKQRISSNFTDDFKRKEEEFNKNYEEQIKKQTGKVKSEFVINQKVDRNQPTKTIVNQNFNYLFIVFLGIGIVIGIFFIIFYLMNFNKPMNNYDNRDNTIVFKKDNKNNSIEDSLKSTKDEIPKVNKVKSPEELWLNFHKEFLLAVNEEDVNKIASLSAPAIQISEGGSFEKIPTKEWLEDYIFNSESDKKLFIEMANCKIEDNNYDGHIGKQTVYIEVYQLEFRYKDGKWFFYGIGVS